MAEIGRRAVKHLRPPASQDRTAVGRGLDDVRRTFGGNFPGEWGTRSTGN